MQRSPSTLPHSSFTRWQVMQHAPSHATFWRFHSHKCRSSFRVVTTVAWQRTQKYQMVLLAKLLIAYPNLWNTGLIDA